MAIDEAFFQWDTKKGKKYWSPIGTKIYLPYIGSHKFFTAYGGITRDGRKTFMTCDRFNADTCIEYFDLLRRKYGKVAIVLDGASVHRSRKIKEYLEKYPQIKLIYLPKGMPQLNPVEAYWNKVKYDTLVSEHYDDFETMHKTVSEYFRTAKVSIGFDKYIFRSPAKMREKSWLYYY